MTASKPSRQKQPNSRKKWRQKQRKALNKRWKQISKTSSKKIKAGQRAKNRWQKQQAKQANKLWRRYKKKFIKRWKRLNAQSNGWPNTLWLALKNFSEHQGFLMASVIGFHAFISLFPLSLLIVSLTNTLLDPNETLVQYTALLNLLTPGNLQFLEPYLSALQNRGALVQVGAAIILLWTSSSVLAIISRTLDRAWHIEHRGHRLILLRIRAIPLVLAGVIILAFLLRASAGLQLVPFFHWLEETNLAMRAFVFLLKIGLSILLFGVIYWAVPSAKLRWGKVLPGAIAIAPVWTTFTVGLDWYVKQSALFQLVYSSVTAVVVILIWAYISGILLLFGAELSAILYERRQEAKHEL